jgi:hypothetical protein
MTAGTVWTEITRLEARIENILDLIEALVATDKEILAHLQAMDARISAEPKKPKAKKVEPDTESN